MRGMCTVLKYACCFYLLVMSSVLCRILEQACTMSAGAKRPWHLPIDAFRSTFHRLE